MSPWPGKCFPTGSTPRDKSPMANAVPRRPASAGSGEKARSPITGLTRFVSASSTGAKSTSTPTARSSAPIASPRASAIPSLRVPNREQARAGGNSEYGGLRNRATRPPSWSTATSGSGFPRPAADRISRHSARTCAGESMLRANRTTPPTDPFASPTARSGGSDFPSKPTHSGDAKVSFPAIMRKLYHASGGARGRLGARTVWNRRVAGG